MSNSRKRSIFHGDIQAPKRKKARWSEEDVITYCKLSRQYVIEDINSMKLDTNDRNLIQSFRKSHDSDWNFLVTLYGFQSITIFDFKGNKHQIPCALFGEQLLSQIPTLVAVQTNSMFQFALKQSVHNANEWMSLLSFYAQKEGGFAYDPSDHVRAIINADEQTNWEYAVVGLLIIINKLQTDDLATLILNDIRFHRQLCIEIGRNGKVRTAICQIVGRSGWMDPFRHNILKLYDQWGPLQVPKLGFNQDTANNTAFEGFSDATASIVEHLVDNSINEEIMRDIVKRSLKQFPTTICQEIVEYALVDIYELPRQWFCKAKQHFKKGTMDRLMTETWKRLSINFQNKTGKRAKFICQITTEIQQIQTT